MATPSIKPKRDDSLLSDWESVPERAPSQTVAETPTIARLIAFVALAFAAVGTAALLAPLIRWSYWFSPSWGVFFLSLGGAGLLYHAFRDADEQFRFVYFIGAVLLLGAGVILRFIPINEVMGALFLPVGVPCLGAAYLFLLAVLRNEADELHRQRLCFTLGGAGALMSLAGFIGGNINQNFLMAEGIILILLGLLYLGGCIGGLGINSTWGYRIGIALGLLGGAALVSAVFRSISVTIQMAPRFAIHGDFTEFLVPSGVVLGLSGLVYLAISVMLCSDSVFAVLVRRELLAFFFSPMAYLVLLGFVVIGGLQFWWFLESLLAEGGAVEEPFTRNLQYPNFIGLFAITFMIPIITMRLLSEERRTGTLEVLLTAPLNEVSIVLSKFVAAWIFLMLAAAPWWLNLLGLRIIGDTPFDYRPVLSFIIAFAVTGAGFLSTGLFFSAVTRNQIIAAVLTFAGMLALTSIFLLSRQGQPLREAFAYISYLDLWLAALEGLFTPRLLLFHLSLAVFFLFLTTKVLEARKWS